MTTISTKDVHVHSAEPLPERAWLFGHVCSALTDPQRVELATEGRRLHAYEYLAAQLSAMTDGSKLLVVIAEATCCDDAPRLGSYFVMHVG